MATLALAGCDRSDRYLAIEQRSLPAKPDYVREVFVADPQPTAKWRDVAGAERAGRVKANKIIDCFGRWYDRQREQYAMIGERAATATVEVCKAGVVPK
ncbi:hypothetical protein SAMN02745157_1482 [Kaistia soli DSM 19436]|uniref:Uncharacterized protein n=1 Tax=Kaistia soli DSM 19436 TaxID=1122133 RepID=A0A1M4YCB3_9HYPH|nr:hypothetical protein [Kaistia soli]SHF03375.1 hypothetical protein SAMN02745157_1482 [Kaistia soli DSM 19436]